jgi:phosphohistidine phosphatase SixA
MRMGIGARTPRAFGLALALALAAVGSTASSAADSTLSGAALVKALQQGGYVLVMRHANAPAALPDKASADPANTKLERQLDEAGRKSATDMGAAIRALHIPVGTVLISPTYRALQTVQLAQLGHAQAAAELDEPAQGMQGTALAPQAQWLQRKAAEAPPAGTNTVLITHVPNIMAAFMQEGARMEPGEALVFHPDGKGGTTLVARVKAEEWATLPRT